MTLIVGFKTSEGAVICADSQETLSVPLPNQDYADYRVSVDKIDAQRVGRYDVIIAGAGDAALAEGFSEALIDQIETWSAGLSGGELKDKIRRVVMDYHSHEVALCPVEDKDIRFLVCMKGIDSDDVHLWVMRGTAINRVNRYAMIGWEEGIYRHDLDRHYRDNEKNLFSMLVGIHVLLLARDTSNHVGGPVKIAVATRDGLRSIAREDAAELENRVADFDSKLDDLRLRISDTAIPLPDFNQTLSAFQQSVLDLRLSLTGNILLAKFQRLGKATPLDLSAFYDPYISTPAFEESIQALSRAWALFVENHQTKRGLVTATNRLAQLVNIAIKIISATYDAKEITRDQKDAFADRIIEMNQSALWAIEEQHSGNTKTDDQIAVVYSHLTNKIVNPFISLMRDYGNLADEYPEVAKRVYQEVVAAFITMFTWIVLFPVSPEPETAGRQLQSGSTKQLT